MSLTYALMPFHISYYLCCLGIRRNRPIITELFEGTAG